jgi:hypothetical protein
MVVPSTTRARRGASLGQLSRARTMFFPSLEPARKNYQIHFFF